MGGIIDFHAHILPGADHGSADVKTSLKQLELLKGAGISTVIATPHFYPARKKAADFLEKRERCAADLLSMEGAKGIEIILGAEVLVCEGMEHMADLELLTVSGTDVLLLEMPMRGWTAELFETVEEIASRFKVVLAHIDRYPWEDVSELLSIDGVRAQLNVSCLSGMFGYKKFLRLCDEGRIAAIGSDLHGADEKGVKSFSKALARLGDERVEMIMNDTAFLTKSAVCLR